MTKYKTWDEIKRRKIKQLHKKAAQNDEFSFENVLNILNEVAKNENSSCETQSGRTSDK